MLLESMVPLPERINDFFGVIVGAFDSAECGTANANSTQCVHLVRHQGDERRADNRDAVEQQCRELIAERFSATSWDEDKGIIAVEDGLDCAQLVRTEF